MLSPDDDGGRPVQCDAHSSIIARGNSSTGAPPGGISV